MKARTIAAFLIWVVPLPQATRQPEQRVIQRSGTTSTESADKATQEKEAADTAAIKAIATAIAQANEQHANELKAAEYQKNQDIDIQGNIVKYTFWLVIVGVIQFLALIAQGVVFFFTLRTIDRQTRVLQRQHVSMKSAVIAAKEGNQINREMSQAVQRAYVIFPLLDIQQLTVKNETGAVVRWELRTAVENAGNTPTRDLCIYVNCAITGDGGLSDDFGFPDFGTGETFPFSLAAKGKTYSANIPLTYEHASQVCENKSRLFFYGWATYKDVFDSSTVHRTKFCHELSILKVAESLLIGMGIHRTHNSQN